MGFDGEHGGVVTAAVQAEPGNAQGAAAALIILALGVGVAALLDFGVIAGQGLRTGQLILALAPWVLAWRGAGAQLRGRIPLQGAVASVWVLLIAASLAQAVVRRADGVIPIVAASLQAGGALAVLVVLRSAGQLTTRGVVLFVLAAVLLAAPFAAAAEFVPGAAGGAEAFVSTLGAIYLLPQVVHDLQVVMWARRTQEWARARVSLEGVGMPFLLWTLAGHMIIAPAILLWSPKPEVFFGGLGAGLALVLIGARGRAGVISGRVVAAVILVAIIYGVGLGVLVMGGRPYG
ncbi:MAG: hypothetical protein AAFZ18_00850 [Myxococcota bacterium]